MGGQQEGVRPPPFHGGFSLFRVGAIFTSLLIKYMLSLHPPERRGTNFTSWGRRNFENKANFGPKKLNMKRKKRKLFTPLHP